MSPQLKSFFFIVLSIVYGSGGNTAASQCRSNHRINQCENREMIAELNGQCDGDSRQLRARLVLGFSSLPAFASYDALVVCKLAKWGCGLRKYLAHPKKA